MFKFTCTVIVLTASLHAGAAISKQEEKVAKKASLPCQVATTSGDLGSKDYSARIDRDLNGTSGQKGKTKTQSGRVTK